MPSTRPVGAMPAPFNASPGALTLGRATFVAWVAGVVFAAAMMTPSVGHGVQLGFVFNEMLVNLLHGRFDLSPAVIGSEAFVRGGRTYGYFGVFCAMLRLPLLLAGRIGVDVTAASLLAASALSLGFRLMTAAHILGRPGAQDRQALRLPVLVAVVAHGESIQYLHPSLYQEVISWGNALASVFVYLAVRRVLGTDRRPWASYALMAGVAGLALLCRVTFGCGLYGALGLMLLVEAERSWTGGRRLAPIVRRLAPAAAILVLFAALAGGVNAARWGDALSFSPLRLQAVSHRTYPDREARLERYGELNPARIPYALQYYFAPVWSVTDHDGVFLFQKEALRLFDLVELPPSSVFLSDPVACILAGAGLWACRTRRRDGGQVGFDTALARGALIGLSVPIGLMLMLISLTFRYRMEIYPFLDFAAWIGLAALTSQARPLPPRAMSAITATALAGMIAAAVGLAAYAIVPFGSATDLHTSHGWIGVVADRLAGRNVENGHLMPDGRRLPLN